MSTSQDTNINNNCLNKKIIRVAILNAVIPTFISPENNIKALDNYEWKIENQTYTFKVKWITDAQIRNGRLSRRNFDVLIIPGIGKEFRFIYDGRLAIWKNQIKRFVSQGGGYFGMCGGANMAVADQISYEARGFKTTTLWEFCMRRASLGLVEANSYQDMANPYTSSILLRNPSRTGISTFIYYNFTEQGVGISANLSINISHPIFQGYPYPNRLMRWNSGPALIPFSDNVSVLASYPKENFTGPNGSPFTTIHTWQYVGPLSGMFLKQRSFDFWDKEEILETHLAGKPAAIADNYGDGRVVVFGPHPEHPVYFNEKIVESEDSDNNHMYFGDRLYQKTWTSENATYNWWIIRRSVAWAAKIPDEALPPIEL